MTRWTVVRASALQQIKSSLQFKVLTSLAPVNFHRHLVFSHRPKWFRIGFIFLYALLYQVINSLIHWFMTHFLIHRAMGTFTLWLCAIANWGAIEYVVTTHRLPHRGCDWRHVGSYGNQTQDLMLSACRAMEPLLTYYTQMLTHYELVLLIVGFYIIFRQYIHRTTWLQKEHY